ncbi:class I SAM-dependent methyltransferase [Noviherbaspirillum sedimenti]|nr:class I SAM-dependent methyltransferase [Noviherbaspirillum sedimenti]
MTVLKHKDADVHIEQLPNGKNKIDVAMHQDLFIPIKNCETAYPLDLIEKLLGIKGPSWLCDEIMREESPDHVVQKSLHYDLLSFRAPEEFKGKRLLDFGCGSGASTMVLARMFPDTRIVGVELEEKLVSIAKMRAAHYGYQNLELLLSPDPSSLPPSIGEFDYVVLSAVYEHLLPNEREPILHQLWNVLKPGGILFLNQTPYIGFPIETHTTGGLPFINYLPDKLACFYARHFSKRQLQDKSWKELLRMGIRGGSVQEVVDILNRTPRSSILLKPVTRGLKDNIDLWYRQSRTDNRFPLIKALVFYASKLVKMSTGAIMVPYLSLAIMKDKSQNS